MWNSCYRIFSKFLRFSPLIIILPLHYIHISYYLELCDNTDQTAHYNYLAIWVEGFISDFVLGWLKNAKLSMFIQIFISIYSYRSYLSILKYTGIAQSTLRRGRQRFFQYRKEIFLFSRAYRQYLGSVRLQPRFIHSFIHRWFYSPLFGPGLFSSFVIICTQMIKILLDEWSAPRKAATYKQNNTNTE
jgi:hypothetical protein